MYTVVETRDNYINGLGTIIKGASNFICDGDEAEVVAKLPKTVGVGSRALFIESGHIYMFGPSRQWILYKGVSILN